MKKVFRIVGLLFLGLFLFAGCGNQKEKLENTLIEGSGTWTFVTKEGKGKLAFFEDGTSRTLEAGKEYETKYDIKKDGTELVMHMVDSEEYNTIKNIEIENDTTIKGDLSINGEAETSPVKLVK